MEVEPNGATVRLFIYRAGQSRRSEKAKKNLERTKNNKDQLTVPIVGFLYYDAYEHMEWLHETCQNLLNEMFESGIFGRGGYFPQWSLEIENEDD